MLLCYLLLDTYFFAIWLHADNPCNVDNTKIKTNTTTGGGAKTQFCTRPFLYIKEIGEEQT